MSQMFLQFRFALLVGAFVVTMLQVHSQDQSAFISIDCGQQNMDSYMDSLTGLNYIPDKDFIDTGESHAADAESTSDPPRQFQFVRIFPEGTRNCYKINRNIVSGQKYLIRASFWYDNYDKENFLPRFELHLGSVFWDTVVFSGAKVAVYKELIHIPTTDFVHVCLVAIEKGVPFISTIELRPLPNGIYQTENGTSLALNERVNIAADSNTITRFKEEDVYDRIWYPQIIDLHDYRKALNTSSTIISTDYKLPSRVMRTAAAPKDVSSKYLNFSWKSDSEGRYYIYLHFAEVEKSSASSLSANLTTITFNGETIVKPFDPKYLIATTINTTIDLEGQSTLLIHSPGRPILNAYEVYKATKFLVSTVTNAQDVEAITKLKSTYNITENWQGDPCNPKEYLWKGVNCSYSDNDFARIISLNLSSSGLTGAITDSIADLTMIEILDLSNNKLSGQIPDYLSQLPKLKILNLKKNELTGTVPAGLTTNRNLSLSLCGNPSLSGIGKLPCEKKEKKKNQFFIPVVVSMLWITSIAAVLLWKSKKFNADWKQYWRLGKIACTESEIEQIKEGHDVFLSFRGEDTRTGFARNLHDALDNKGIKTFFDDQNLGKGSEIAPALVDAIEASEISIILFSEHYVTSSWCLGELVKILECKKKKDQSIIPVFYKVNPSDIRQQSGSFSLQKWIDKNDANVPVWKEALGEVANLSGFRYKDGYEVETIEKIVKDISDVMEQKKKNSLRRFDTICPPDGEDEIVIYVTSSARDSNFKNCQSMIQSLSQFVLKVQMRDVTIRKFRRELKKLMEKELPSPRLFVHGKYVGGYDDVSRLIKEEPWFCEALNKLQRRDEMSSHGRNLQQEEAGSVRDSGTESDGHGGSPV